MQAQLKIKTLLIAVVLFVAASCKSQTIVPAPTATSLPTETHLPSTTATQLPTDTPLSSETPAPGDVFGSIPLNSVQAFTLEPVAKAIFEQTLQGYVSAGKIQEFRVDHISVFPSGNGTLITEIMYSLHTVTDPWPEDFGTAGTDDWITGKCSRFDLIATDTEHQLKNKRLCS